MKTEIIDDLYLDENVHAFSKDPIPSSLYALLLAYQLVWMGEKNGVYQLASETIISEEVQRIFLFWSNLPIEFIQKSADWLQKAFQAQCVHLERISSEFVLDNDQSFNDNFPLKTWLWALFKKTQELECNDIHFELQDKKFQIRIRLKGTIEVMAQPHWLLGKYVMNIIKNLSNLVITEKILPQDGRFSYKADGVRVQYRVSSLPTHLGESLVLRLLKDNQWVRGLSNLGIPADIQDEMLNKIRRSQGLLIMTGPTGSGKTTTLYALLQMLSEDSSLKIITIEDPIEYPMPQMTQIKISVSESYPMQAILKSALRHDPEVLFIGEIRDAQTARLAVEAALTGHLVLTSLHASTPWHGLLRLIEWGVDRCALANVLEGVWGQQLTRTYLDGKAFYGLRVESFGLTEEVRQQVQGECFNHKP